MSELDPGTGSDEPPNVLDPAVLVVRHLADGKTLESTARTLRLWFLLRGFRRGSRPPPARKLLGWTAAAGVPVFVLQHEHLLGHLLSHLT